jgi:hypothetical protein
VSRKNKSLSLSLSLSLVLLFGLFACQEIPDAADVDMDKSIGYIAKDPDYEKQLKSLSLSSNVNYGVERFGKFMSYLKPQIQL